MAKKKTAKKEAPVTADEIPVEEYDGTRYTPWIPANMPIGGKSNSTEQLNDHPTEHNHSAEAISDIVDRFADLRLYVPAANSCGVDGALEVNGQVSTPARFVGPAHGNYTVPPYSFAGREDTGVYASADFVGISNDGNYKLLCANDFVSVFGDLYVDGVTKLNAGTQAAPAYSFTNDITTGIYYTGPDPGWNSKAIVSISANGTAAANFGDKGCSIPPAYASTVPNRANMYIDSDGALHRSTAAVFDIEESDYNELVEKVAALTAQIETLMDRVESLERLTPITADA